MMNRQIYENVIFDFLTLRLTSYKQECPVAWAVDNSKIKSAPNYVPMTTLLGLQKALILLFSHNNAITSTGKS